MSARRCTAVEPWWQGSDAATLILKSVGPTHQPSDAQARVKGVDAIILAFSAPTIQPLLTSSVLFGIQYARCFRARRSDFSPVKQVYCISSRTEWKSKVLLRVTA